MTGVNLPVSASSDEILGVHNKYRQEVKVSPLAWSSSPQKFALDLMTKFNMFSGCHCRDVVYLLRM
jgi:hypothetical protein